MCIFLNCYNIENKKEIGKIRGRSFEMMKSENWWLDLEIITLG